MNVQPASLLLSALALALPLWYLPASFEAFLLPKTVLLATGGLAAALRLKPLFPEAIATLDFISRREGRNRGVR